LLRGEPAPMKTQLKALRAQIVEERSLWVAELAAQRGVDPFQALVSEILPLLDAAQWLERRAAKVLRSKSPGWLDCPAWMLGHRLVVHRRPHGHVLIVGPGNYPLFLPGVQLLQALVAGNTVSVKPQKGCEGPIRRLIEALYTAGVERSRVTLLDSGIDSVYQELEQRADLVVLTGSLETGRKLLPACAARPLPVIAELSGQDLVIVGPGADRSILSSALEWARGLNFGNTCMCPQRVWLPEDLELESDVSIRRYKHTDQVLQWLAEEKYGLGISLFGHESWVDELLPHCRSGFVTVNDIIAPTADPRAPFGGRGLSGHGVTRGEEGLLAMTYPQAVFSNRGPRFHLWPPSGRELALMAAYTDFSHGGPWRRVRASLSMGWAWARLVYRIIKMRKGRPPRQGERSH
jgi:acyl-CoA reductase-like NAD-dependent aldehyde dehydrogenase